MRTHLFQRRVTLVALTITAVVAAALLPFITASCRSQRSAADEAVALDRLRAMTRRGVLPAESVIAGIESEYTGTKAGALARVLRARVRIEARDFTSAASLLEGKEINRLTALGDYALLLRAQALEQGGRRVEARAAFEQLARDFPASLRARAAVLRGADLSFEDGQAGAVPLLVKTLTAADDAAALLLAAKASEQSGDTTRALGLYRRLYFYAPAAPEAAGASAALARLNSTTSPATADEATARADKLFAAKRYAEAADAYADAFARFAAAATVAAQLRRSVAAANARRIPDAVAALSALSVSAVDERSEALHHLALAYARARQWDAVRSTLTVMTSAHTRSPWTMRALVAAGQLAKEAKNAVDAAQFFRAAVNTFPGQSEVASAQFELAWQAHEAKNFQESSRLFVEHLAEYAGKNTDNRGRAGYWASRDSERAGRLSEARALYRAMLARYDANWYGYLAKQRLDQMARGTGAEKEFPADSPIGRAAANLAPVTIATETAGPEADERIAKADQLSIVGLDEWAHEELDKTLESTPTSPRLNLAKARIFRSRDENVQAFNVLRRSFPDYSQMKPEELTSDEWDVFYPLAHWEIITQEARARNLDPYTVAGLIRQESVFNPRAVSSANAYGLMQLLVPTGRLMAKRAGVERPVTATALFEPRLNIQLGTSYMRDNIDKFGRIEYVAAAYNAGPGRVGPWRASLPLEIDEWVEAIPFKETRGYVQGVVRNMLQYRRLYDERGRFRAEVGTRATRRTSATNQAPASTMPADHNVRPRRATGNDEEDE